MLRNLKICNNEKIMPVKRPEMPATGFILGRGYFSLKKFKMRLRGLQHEFHNFKIKKFVNLREEIFLSEV